MTEATLNGRRLKLAPSKLIGSGGEADVYDIGSGLALKLFKGPDHPDYAGLPDEARAARERLKTRGEKISRFPRALPPRVVAPMEAATDRTGKVIGYTMRLVADGEPLLRWAEPVFRRAIAPAAVGALFLDAHATVARVHEAGVVIGDFNDLNVLVAAGLAYFIDADSFQFGGFPCSAYTERFVDPLCCPPDALRPVRPFSAATDWYAFETLLFQSLLLVHPYGGVLPGKAKAAERTLDRVTVFHPKVRYPKAAVPWRMLPDNLLQRFHATFEEDERSPFPRSLLEGLRWSRCADCGAAHARAACPECVGMAPATQKKRLTVRGSVTAVRLLETEGEVVALGPDAWLVYLGGEFRREDGTVALRGPLRPGSRYFLHRRGTIVVGRNEPYAFAGGRGWWERDGALWREGDLGDERVGEVLGGQTRFWVGPAFGFGFYRAGGVVVAFTFRADRRGLADGVRLPPLRGRVLDADCVFGADRAWLLMTLEYGGVVFRRCTAIRADGSVRASLDSPPWLESIHGACAAGPFLFVPTDRGVVRVDETLVATVEFPDTEPFVDAASRLWAAEDGILVANRREVLKLSVKQEVPV